MSEQWSKVGDNGAEFRSFRLRRNGLNQPLAKYLPETSSHFEEIMNRHQRAVLHRRPTYFDPHSGFAVFTAQFLADRGYCCGSGCRHCPYEPDVS